jgi:hypothetical protein
LPIIKLAPIPITDEEETKNNVAVSATVSKNRDAKNVSGATDESTSRK